MFLVVGYDHHPASRAALIFAGLLAARLDVPVRIVHVVGDAEDVVAAPATSAGGEDLSAETQHIADALVGVTVQWTYDRRHGDPATELLDAAHHHEAMMVIVGRPEHGISAAVGHLITGNVARNVLRRSNRPVVVVPEFGGVKQ